MDLEFANADRRALHEPFAERLATIGREATLKWLVGVLDGQRPALRASNASLVAYTGCADALEWLVLRVDEPVVAGWGYAAALLGASWPQVETWIRCGGPHLLMGLDTLIAYRRPRPNMAPLAQIAAPVLPEQPTQQQFELLLKEAKGSDSSPRVRRTVSGALSDASEILEPRQRGVAVADLPRLYLQPESFKAAGEVLERHDAVVRGVRTSIEQFMNERTRLH